MVAEGEKEGRKGSALAATGLRGPCELRGVSECGITGNASSSLWSIRILRATLAVGRCVRVN